MQILATRANVCFSVNSFPVLTCPHWQDSAPLEACCFSLLWLGDPAWTATLLRFGVFCRCSVGISGDLMGDLIGDLMGDPCDVTGD